LSASTCNAISVATFGSVFIKKCVAPIRLFDRAEEMLDRLTAHAHRGCSTLALGR
jgi:hypothetical protein